MEKNQSLFLLGVIFVLVSLRFAYFNVFNLFLFFPTPNWHDNGKKPTEFSSKNNEHNEILRETFNCSITHCPCRFYWQTNSTFWIPIVHGSEFYRLDKTKEFFCSFINIMIVILKYFIFWVVVKTIKKTIGETFLFVFVFTGLQMLCFYHHLTEIFTLSYFSDNYILSSNTYVSNNYLTRRYTSKKSIL